MEKPNAYRAILMGGLIAGALDITFAFIFYGMRNGSSPVRILQSIASGALGAKAFTGGAKTAILGGVFHFFIAISAAAIYYFASRVLRFMVTHAVISGILYGVCVYLVMYGLVLRFSAIHSTRYPWQYPWPVLTGNLLIHMLGIGLTIALVVRRFSK